MQALYAYGQCKEANYNVSVENIERSFEPDLNSMEIQDSVQLAKNKKEALKDFKESIHNQKTGSGANKAAINAIQEYYNQIDNDTSRIKKNMLIEVEGLYDKYIKVLNLLISFSHFAKEGVGTRKSEPQAQRNLVNNLLIQNLSDSKSLEALSLKKNLKWESEKNLIRDWFRNIVAKDDTYLEYLALENAHDKDSDIVNHIVRKIIFKNESIQSFWENLDLNWAENKAIIRSLVLKTIKSLEEKTNEFELATMSYNWAEDKEFFEKLFDSTVKEEKFLQDLVAEKTENWEFDRIAYTDRLILMLAVSEMMNFPSIPIKVTINEYIEVSKNYSTPKSKQFVNGVLDVIAVDLQKNGLIKKSGRGLIDNK